MTERPVSARTRKDDTGLVTRVRAFVVKWKDPVIAVVVPPLAVATVWLGLQQRALQIQRTEDTTVVRHLAERRAHDTAVVRLIAEQQAAQQKATAAAAKVSCQRTRQYGPAFADYFESVGVFSAKDAAAYRSSIPKTCPK